MPEKRKLEIAGVEEGGLQDMLRKLAKKASVPGASKAGDKKEDSSSDSDSDSSSSDSSSNSSDSDNDSDDKSSSSSNNSSSSSDSDSDSDSDSSDDEEEMEKRAKQKQEAREKEKATSQAAINAWMEKTNASPSPTKKKKGDESGVRETSGSKAFKRVDTDVWSKEIINGLEDNTYSNTFGEGGYGAKASAKLLQVQGKRFQHEKTKAKRSSSYKGGMIDASAASKSFKYEDSD
jgi:hypothetical protein